jgi:hypothetical protein
VVADHVLEVAVSVAAAELADLAWRMCVVTMQVNVAPPAAAEALLDARRIGVAKVGSLWDAELEAEPSGKVGRRKAKEGV